MKTSTKLHTNKNNTTNDSSIMSVALNLNLEKIRSFM